METYTFENLYKLIKEQSIIEKNEKIAKGEKKEEQIYMNNFLSQLNRTINGQTTQNLNNLIKTITNDISKEDKNKSDDIDKYLYIHY